MGWPKQLVLVRHAESQGNVLSTDERAKCSVASHLYQLTERGKRQAEITGEYVRNTYGKFDAYYTSYYARVQQTMRIMYPEAKIYEDPRLAEAQRGRWHVLTKQQMKKLLPFEVVAKEKEGLYHYRPLGGENWPDVELRIHSFLGTLCRDLEGKRIIIAVHGHWLILFQRLIHHFSIDEAVRRYEMAVFENASVTVYEEEENRGTSHLILKEENRVPWEGVLSQDVSQKLQERIQCP